MKTRRHKGYDVFEGLRVRFGVHRNNVTLDRDAVYVFDVSDLNYDDSGQ